MERIYDENLNEWAKFLSDQNGEYDIKIDCQTLKMMVQELKELRAADKPLDIKGQLRLVRDRCPELWKMVRSDIADCPEVFQLSGGECLAKNCKECWDKALEGDE